MSKKFMESSKASFLGSALRLAPILLAAGVLGPHALLPGLCVAALWIPMERARLPLIGLIYVLLQDVTLRHNRIESLVAALLFAALGIGMLLLYAAKGEKAGRLRAKLAPPDALYPAVTMGAAAIMTLYQCAGYFGTGAQGAGLFALLRSYRNLGFHPNWRTVLFSTIMMVVLITWPRKFPRLSKALPSGFVGVLIVTALNAILYWDPARSPVPELGVTRLPVSALSMLLIFVAWEEVPWKRLKTVVLENHLFERVLLCVVPVMMFCYDLLWVMAGLFVMWEILFLVGIVKMRRVG